MTALAASVSPGSQPISPSTATAWASPAERRPPDGADGRGRATTAKACNIGHGVTGLGLLSLGSLVAVGAMTVGVVAASAMLRRGEK